MSFFRNTSRRSLSPQQSGVEGFHQSMGYQNPLRNTSEGFGITPEAGSFTPPKYQETGPEGMYSEMAPSQPSLISQQGDQSGFMFNPEYEQQRNLLELDGDYQSKPLEPAFSTPSTAPSPSMTGGQMASLIGLGSKLYNQSQPEQAPMMQAPPLRQSNPFAFLKPNNPYYGGM